MPGSVVEGGRAELPTPSQVGVVTISGRPTVHAFFTELAREHQASVSVTLLPLDSSAVTAAREALEAADVAVVDASVDRADAIAVCTTLRLLRPRLPISAVFCCP